MISFRLSVIALSAALIFSIGSSASTASPNYSHPDFSVADGSTLNLRETGSQIVVETIENALRQGGLALLGEGFQLDSSLSYHSGDNEGIEGDLDVVIPLWNGGRHAIFTQPGFVFWKGMEGEKRFDGNIGLVYRAELTRGFIAGASIFYDQDFEIGHSRVSGGLDLQSGYFRFGANYYHPLSEIEDGREGFVEEALRGMDARIIFEREIVRLGSTIGYWEYDGGEDVEDEWKTSIGLDFGVRILPGVFAEASWERHKDNIVLDERIFAGLAFKFSLPDFEGASYGDGSMSANLYKIVDREKRILYEERVGVPSVSIVRTGNETIAADEEVTVAVDVQLSEALAENVTINLVGSGSATYSEDYTVSVGGTDCPMVTEANCQVMITAGQLTPSGDVTITIINDGRTNEPDESIVLSMVVASPANTDLLPRGPFTLTIPADPPLPSVSISATSTSFTEGGSATLTATLSEEVDEDVVINLLEGGAADYGTSMDWHLNNGSDCSTATGTSCQITITAGQTSATATVNVNTDMTFEGSEEEFTVEIDIASAGSTGVIEGSPSSLTFTIEAEVVPTVSLNYNGSRTIPEGGGARSGRDHIAWITIELSRALTTNVTVNIVGGGDASYGRGGIGNDWDMRIQPVTMGGVPDTTSDLPSNTACTSATGSNCQATFTAGVTIVQVQVIVYEDGNPFSSSEPAEGEENFNVSIDIASAGSTGLILGNSTSLMFTIPENRT